MSFEVSWYLPERIIHVHVLAELDLSQIERMAHIVAEYIQAGTPPIHILLDDSKGGRPPISLKELQARLRVVNDASIGWVVGIGEVDAVAKFLIPLGMKLAHIRYTRVKDVSEAVEFIARYDINIQRMLAK